MSRSQATLSVLGCLGLAVGAFVLVWVLFLANIFGPGNVSRQFDVLYSDYAAMQATARNVCQARKDETATPPGSAHDQRTSQRIAYEQTYRRIEADYDQALANVFKAGLVKPANLPSNAPTLDDAVGLWCPA